MKCTDIREVLPDLAAGLLRATPEVNDHLHSCAECSGKLEEFRKTMALLDEWQAPEPSPYFDTRLHARLREEAAKQQHSWFAWLRRPAIAVSLAVALVAGVSIFEATRIQKPNHNGSVAGVQPPPPVVLGTAVGDLQVLDNNHDLFADADSDSASDLLDDLQVQQDVTANP